MIDKIKIGSFTFAVEITDKPIIVDNDSSYTGMINYHENKILIKTGLAEEVQKQILYHEVIHGIIAEYEINLKEDNEEKIVNCIAKGIYRLLLDNPELKT